MATLGTADDSAQADGENVLDYGQASTRALDWKPDEDGQLGKLDVVTVRETVEHYLDWYRAHRKAYDRIRSVFGAHILPELGDLRIDALTARRIRRWHQSIGSAQPQGRLRASSRRRPRMSTIRL